MQMYGKTNIGKVRDTNQDAFGTYVIGNNIGFAVVCDGMGGANGGHVASKIAVNEIKETILNMFEKTYSEKEIENMLKLAFYNANMKIYEQAKSDESLSGMGTTAEAAFFINNSVYIIHIGDSRTYKISKTKAEKLTKDHSMVQALIDIGEITESDAKTHPQKNIITKVLGVDIDIEPDFLKIYLERDEYILLCTDGLFNLVNIEETYMDIFNSNMKNYVNDVVKAALNNGGNDNITAVVLGR